MCAAKGGMRNICLVLQPKRRSNRSSTSLRVTVRHRSCMADARGQTNEESCVTIMRHHLARAKIRDAVIACAALVLAAPGCTDDDKNAACSWLSAPASFVEAPIAPGCTAEPAGQRCDTSTGVCTDVCPPGQFRLTCIEAYDPRFSNPEEAVQDPVTGGRKSSCTAVVMDGGAPRTRAEYCCQCE
jgi:hypothetical protein